MGSGKSTLGKKLARLMQRKFIDLDHYIEKREGASIQSIFDTYGEAVFRAKETFYLAEVLAITEPLVIALGGGTVCFNNNLAAIRQHGFLIYLELPVAVLADRVSNSRKQRPLLRDLSGEALTAFIAERLQQRRAFYEQAQLSISGVQLTPQLLQQAIHAAQQDHSA